MSIAENLSFPTERAEDAANQPDDDISQIRRAQSQMPNLLRNRGETARLLFSYPQPRITLLGDFLTPEECAAVIALAQPGILPSLVVDNSTGNVLRHEARTSYGVFFPRGMPGIIATIEARVEALLGDPVSHQEPTQVLRYSIDEEYMPHHDYFDPTEEGREKLLQNGGQRTATLIMYLNDVACGGATIFPELGMMFNPQRGNALYFENLDETGALALNTLHAGAPIGEGEKWIATKWIRQSAYTSGAAQS